MAIEIVDFPIKNGDFPLRTVSSPEGNQKDPTNNDKEMEMDHDMTIVLLAFFGCAATVTIQLKLTHGAGKENPDLSDFQLF